MKTLITKLEKNNTKVHLQIESVRSRIINALEQENEGVSPNIDNNGMAHAPFDGYFCDDTPYGKGQFIPLGDNAGGTCKIHKGRVKMSLKHAQALPSLLEKQGVKMTYGKSWGEHSVCYAYMESYWPSNITIIIEHFKAIEEGNKKALDKKLQKIWDAKCAMSAHLGELGERLIFNCKITRVSTYEGTSFSYYDSGMRVIIELTDNDGNVITYFGSQNNIGDEGQIVTVKGTIKQHTDYKGLKQTVIQRPKLIEQL